MYNMVQRDSDIEVQFVREQLQQDDSVAFYFKFPPQFKVPDPELSVITIRIGDCETYIQR
jgi:restriction endonuclease